MSTTLTGKVVKILPQESGTGAKGEWRKQPFVIETNDQYPKKVCFESWGNAADHAENLKPGQDIKVHFNAESREHNDRWFTSLRAWKVEFNTNEPVKDSPTTKPQSNGNEEEDLPF